MNLTALASTGLKYKELAAGDANGPGAFAKAFTSACNFTKQSHTKLAVKVLVSKFRVNCTEMINTGELF